MNKNADLEHFLHNFNLVKEPLAVFGGRVFTLSKSQPNDYFLLYNKQKFALEESEEISEIEKKLFKRDAERFQVFMSSQIKKKINSDVENISLDHNIYESFQDSSIENFILNDVFSIFNNEEQVSEQKKTPEVKANISDLYSKDNCLDSLLIHNGFLYILDNCFYFDRINKPTNESINFGSHHFSLKPWVPMDELCRNYSKSIMNKAKSVANKHAISISSNLEQLKKEKQAFENKLQLKKQLSERNCCNRGNLNLKKIGQNKYEISVSVQPYIIQRKNKFYFFKATKVGTTITAKENCIFIESRPHIISERKYQHPFVFSNNDICYGEFNWNDQIGINFTDDYNISNRKDIARRVSNMLKKGKNTLERGYVTEKVSPILKIENFDCVIANNERDAKEYAKKNNIKLDRIIKNE